MRSSSFVLLFLASLLLCLLTPSTVSADGSIQPFIDQTCTQPTGNYSLIPVVSSPQCQWVTLEQDVVVSFSYWCNSYTNFSLSVYVNTSPYCVGDADFSITSTNLDSYCSVATYDDPNNHVLFYGQFSCAGNWQSPHATSELTAGVSNIRQVAAGNVEAARMIPQLSGLLPHVKNSALEKLVRRLEQKKEQ